MSLFTRLSMAVSTGWAAALEAWRGDTSDTIDTRALRYSVLWGFYLNDIYDELVHDVAQTYKANRDLYTSIKGIYNPVTRLVDFYVAKIAGGRLDPTGEAGALPLEGLDAAAMQAVGQVWQWSRWGLNKQLWVRYGAALGDSVIKVVEDRALEQVLMQVHYPADLAEVDFERDGSVSYAVFEYGAQERQADGSLVDYVYREEITPESFATYRNGEPWDYVNGVEDGPYTAWVNDLGFVPVVVTRHKQSGQSWGLCAFHNGLRKIDDLNDLASHLGDQIRKAIHPQWVSFGTQAGSGMERSDKLWHHPDPNGKVQALIDDLNIADTTAEIQARLAEIERDFPELKVYKMSDRDLSGRAVQLLLGDVIDRVTEAREQYDAALAEAQRMALEIGALRGYWPDGEFEHQIGAREIFPLTREEELALEQMELSVELQRLNLRMQRLLVEGE